MLQKKHLKQQSSLTETNLNTEVTFGVYYIKVNQQLLVADPNLDKRRGSRLRQCTSRSKEYLQE